PDTCTGESACSAEGVCLDALGVGCQDSAACASGHCVDGVCCDQSCPGTCEACDGASLGVCSPIVGDPHGDRPPCAAGFVCDGLSAECAELSLCEDGHLGKGPDGSSKDCSPYACSGDGACFTRCESVFDCASPFICDADGACVEPTFARPELGCAAGASTKSPSVRFAALVACAICGLRRRRGRRSEGAPRR
ncbi:MAG: hypothetical protein JNK04_22755, partial [Myxococcales bacterium]|nr:hypothetical protein [Myxococcales bacterium]